MKLREIREQYYELYLDGDLFHTGSFTECQEYALRCVDDDLAECYQVTMYEQKVVL